MKIRMILTMNQKTIETFLPVESEMNVVDFFLSLQKLLKDLDENKDGITTFDIYSLSFERVAIVGDNDELYIEKEYEYLETIGDLIYYGLDTIEVIALGKTSVNKVLKEEKILQDALDNYEF